MMVAHVPMEARKRVRGIAEESNVAKITVVGVPDRPGIAAAIPGRAGTPTTVIFATLLSSAIPRTRFLASIGTWATIIVPRSEERRGGKKGKTPWLPYQSKNKNSNI